MEQDHWESKERQRPGGWNRRRVVPKSVSRSGWDSSVIGWHAVKPARFIHDARRRRWRWRRTIRRWFKLDASPKEREIRYIWKLLFCIVHISSQWLVDTPAPSLSYCFVRKYYRPLLVPIFGIRYYMGSWLLMVTQDEFGQFIHPLLERKIKILTHFTKEYTLYPLLVQ